MTNKLYEIQKKALEKSIKLRELSYDDTISFEKQEEIRKQQDDAYKKYNFIKNLRSSMLKGGAKCQEK